jgi:phosphoribosyl 1,2-cyclic phosphodiesterase
VIRFASLGSGSKGNATLIQANTTCVMLDCGFYLRDVESRLERLAIEPASLSGIVVSHEHNDHIGGVARFARKHGVPVWMTPGTFAAWDDPFVPNVHRFNPHDPFRIGDIEVQPFPVPHDAREPCHYVFAGGDRRLGVVSDAGFFTPHMRGHLSGCDALMLEFNHDVRMLLTGPYSPSLKSRVGGPMGHLSNAQSADLLRQIDCTRLQHLVLTHLSEINNTPQLARLAACEALARDEAWLVCADQADGLAWREIA